MCLRTPHKCGKRKAGMEFNPNNNVVRLCLQGMGMEEKGKPEEAGKLFLQAWNEATNAFEKFISAHHVARHQKAVSDKLRWLETALQVALEINGDTVKSAFLFKFPLSRKKTYPDAPAGAAARFATCFFSYIKPSSPSVLSLSLIFFNNPWALLSFSPASIMLPAAKADWA